MKPLLVLVISFAISLVLFKVLRKEFKYALSARIAMSIMLVFTAIAHFVFSKGMSMMIPSFIPFKEGMVFGTGILEILLAIGIQIPKLRFVSGWILFVFLILLLPANINASLQKVNYQNGTFDGYGIQYLWFRVPLQFFFILWVYVCTIRN